MINMRNTHLAQLILIIFLISNLMTIPGSSQESEIFRYEFLDGTYTEIFVIYENGDSSYSLTNETSNLDLHLLKQLSGHATFGQIIRLQHELLALGIADLGDEGDVSVSMLTASGLISVSYSSQSNLTSDIHHYIGKYLEHFNGEAYEKQVWPLGIEIMVMESFPEQYGVTTYIQRGADLMTVVLEFEVNLYVYDGIWGTEEIETQTPAHTATENVSIASGGNSVQIGFDTFSLGAEIRPENITIIVEVPSYDVYMTYGSDDFGVSEGIIIHEPGLPTQTFPGSLPINVGMFAVSFISIALTASYKSKNYRN